MSPLTVQRWSKQPGLPAQRLLREPPNADTLFRPAANEKIDNVGYDGLYCRVGAQAGRQDCVFTGAPLIALPPATRLASKDSSYFSIGVY